MRYSNETKEKANGVVYTPREMVDCLANQMINFSKIDLTKQLSVSVLDPAVGEGELLIALIQEITSINHNIDILAVGYETGDDVAADTQSRLTNLLPNVTIRIITNDFLAIADLIEEKFDFIIANSPYIRTQTLGSNKAQEIAQKWV